MRVNGSARGFTNGGGSWRDTYATKTRDGRAPLPGHDDLDVLDELEAAGLVLNIGTGLTPFLRLTPAGQYRAAELRVHRAAHGGIRTFAPSPIPPCAS